MEADASKELVKPLTTQFSQAKVKNIKKTPALPSVNAIKKQIEEKENAPETQESRTEEREEFDTEMLKETWDIFAEKIKKEGKSSDYNALKGELLLTDSENIKLIISNKFQQVAIESLKQDLLTHLRTHLKNHFINLEVEIKKIDEKELRYTSREKFEYLAEKYPNLRELQSRLDLDPDF